MADKSFRVFDAGALAGDQADLKLIDLGDGDHALATLMPVAEGTLLASAARTTTTMSAEQNNPGFRGVMLWFNVTAVAASESVQLILETKDPVSGGWRTILSATAITAVTTPAGYQVYPGAGASGLTGVAAVALPKTWRVRIVHSGAGSHTYSVGYAYLP